MAMKVSMFMGMSVDGFVARADDGLDFLSGDEEQPGGGPSTFAAFFATVDVLVMGRRTFDVVRGFGEAGWPYGDKRMVVLSRTLTELPPGTRPSVRIGRGAPAEVLAGLAAEGVGHVYVDGAQTAREYLAAGQITDIVVTYVPVLIGSGISAWGPLPSDVRVEVVDHQLLGGRAMQIHYRVQR